MSETDFNKYFVDTRKSSPKKGQVLARFCAMADLMDGWAKQNLVGLLLMGGGVESAQKVMKNVMGAADGDCINVPLQMARDLAEGASKEDVYAKPYRFRLERFWYAEKDKVPKDPHWTVLELTGMA